MDKNKQEELLAGELFEMIALGWTDEEARENKEAFSTASAIMRKDFPKKKCGKYGKMHSKSHLSESEIKYSTYTEEVQR